MNSGDTRKHLVLALVLAAATLAVYLPSLGNGFVDLDDHAYLDANPQLRVGLTRHSVAWAFTTVHVGSGSPSPGSRTWPTSSSSAWTRAATT